MDCEQRSSTMLNHSWTDSLHLRLRKVKSHHAPEAHGNTIKRSDPVDTTMSVTSYRTTLSAHATAPCAPQRERERQTDGAISQYSVCPADILTCHDC